MSSGGDGYGSWKIVAILVPLAIALVSATLYVRAIEGRTEENARGIEQDCRQHEEIIRKLDEIDRYLRPYPDLRPQGR